MPGHEWLNNLHNPPELGGQWPGVLGVLSVHSFELTESRTGHVGESGATLGPVLFAVSGYNNGYSLPRYLVASSIRRDPDRLRYEIHAFVPDSDIEGCTEDMCGVAEATIAKTDDGLEMSEYQASGVLSNGGLLVGKVALGTALLRGYKGGAEIHGGRMQLASAQVMVEDRQHSWSDAETAAAFNRVLTVARSITRLSDRS